MAASIQSDTITLIFVFLVFFSQVSPSLLQQMHAFYAPHNTELEELLGVSLPESWTTMTNLRERLYPDEVKINL